MSYEYVNNKALISSMKSKGADILNQLKMAINADDNLEVEFELVGSAKRNLITRNGKQAPDIDFNLFVTGWNEEEYDIDIEDGQAIKDYIIEMLNRILKKKKLKNCSDSTSALTIKNVPLSSNERFSIDIAIVYKDNDFLYRLIHSKTGDKKKDRWYWNKGIDYSSVLKKEKEIKSNGYWEDVKNMYIKRKNNYLKKQDINHPSFVVYIETINNVYNTMVQDKNKNSLGMFR